LASEAITEIAEWAWRSPPHGVESFGRIRLRPLPAPPTDLAAAPRQFGASRLLLGRDDALGNPPVHGVGGVPRLDEGAVIPIKASRIALLGQGHGTRFRHDEERGRQSQHLELTGLAGGVDAQRAAEGGLGSTGDPRNRSGRPPDGALGTIARGPSLPQG